MTDNIDPQVNGLRFFGKITASVTHEIKNVLAIINEKAGILDDLLMMSAKGMELDPERIKNITSGILHQIQRGNTITKNFNRFAHTTDHIYGALDLNEIVLLLVTLSARIASNRGVNLETSSAGSSRIVNTCPFFLETLIWQCLDFSMENAGEDKTIQIATDVSNRAFIYFSGLDPAKLGGSIDFPDPKTTALCKMLQGEIHILATDGKLEIELPEHINP